MKTDIQKIIISVFVVVVITIITWAFWRSGEPNSDPATGDSQGSERPAAVDQALLTTEYETAVRTLLPRYAAALSTGERTELEGIQDELLALRLPQADREAHVALILLADRRLNGTTAVEAQAALAALRQTYPWLAAEGE